jgi:hypothetical protein
MVGFGHAAFGENQGTGLGNYITILGDFMKRYRSMLFVPAGFLWVSAKEVCD